MISPSPRRDLRTLLIEDPEKAVAIVLEPIVELWREALDLAGFPDIDDEPAMWLYDLRLLLKEGLGEAIRTGVLEARLRAGIFETEEPEPAPQPRRRTRRKRR